MSRARNYSADTIATMKRFYEAFDKCLEIKLIRSISWFCDTYSIDKRHLYAQRKDLGRGYFECGWLLPLIRDFAVSPNWLLTGEGDMFRKNRLQKLGVEIVEQYIMTD